MLSYQGKEIKQCHGRIKSLTVRYWNSLFDSLLRLLKLSHFIEHKFEVNFCCRLFSGKKSTWICGRDRRETHEQEKNDGQCCLSSFAQQSCGCSLKFLNIFSSPFCGEGFGFGFGFGKKNRIRIWKKDSDSVKPMHCEYAGYCAFFFPWAFFFHFLRRM